MRSNLRKYALKRENRIGVRFIRCDMQGVFLKRAEIFGSGSWLKYRCSFQ
jgi:hypothetical protein